MNPVLRSAPAAPAGAPPKTFNLPADLAESSLKKFSTQSGTQVVFATSTAGAVRTNEVTGDFTPREALDRLLAGTGLIVEQDAKTGALIVARGPNGQRAAQTAASDRPRPNPNSSADPGATIELSPFVVTSETGWNATETISGTRLRTDLRDVPNEIEIFTKDFMDDLGLNNISEALIYSANSENNTEFLPSNAETPSFYSNDAGGRVRGIGGATTSMNLFQTGISSDNYNIESTTLVSGPNSTLFGLGSPAGTLEISPAQATMRNRVGTRLQYSSENSKRVALDLNRVVIPKILAIRLMALWKDDQTHNKPNHDTDKRITGSVTFKPFKNTTLRARVEQADRDGNRAPRTAPYDGTSVWLFANQVPGSPYAAGKPGYDNRAALPANLTATTRIFAAGPASATLITSNPSAPVMSWAQSVRVLNPSAATAFGVPDASLDSGINRTFLDESIVPFDINPFGDLKSTLSGGRTTTIVLEQKLAENLFLEVAANHEKTYQKVLGARGQNLSAIYPDANLYLPALLPGQTEYTANPNFGKYYVEYTPNPNPSEARRQDLRATLSYELNLQRKFTGWGRWLGQHRFAGLVSRNESSRVAQLNLLPRILDDPLIPGRALTDRTATNWAINPTRQLQLRSYLDTSFRPVAPLNALDEPFQYVDGNGRTFSTTGGADSGLVAPNGKRLSTSQSVLTGGKDRTDTQLIAWQGRFLPDREGATRLILTYGYREDAIKAALPDVASRTQDAGPGRTGFYPLYTDATWDPFGLGQTGITRNTGVVLRPLRWLSLLYNNSATFAVNSGQFDPFGVGRPGAQGEGRDYGVRLDLWQGKFSLRLNKYENVLGPSRAANNIDDPFRSALNRIESRVQDLDPALAGPNNWFLGGLNYGYDNYHVHSDRTSKGYELTFDFRPVPNWNIRINGAKATAVEDNIGHDWIAWIKQRLPVWVGVVAKNGEVDAAGRPATWLTADSNPDSGIENRPLQQYYSEQLVGTTLAFLQAAEGRVTDGSRGKRANLISNYRFTEGRLKGLTVGGAVRWRPAPTIGYPVVVNQLGTKLLDVANPHTGKPEIPVDASLGYRGRLRYFGGVGYNIQLNIRNALNQDRPIPVTAFSDGTIARLATVEPRLFILSVGFDY